MDSDRRDDGLKRGSGKKTQRPKATDAEFGETIADGGHSPTEAETDTHGAIAKRGRGQPKFRRRAEARKDEVLDAALELFIEKGYASTRVEDIAAKAGISKGTVYLYFDSKEALMEGLIHRALTPIALNVVSTIDKMGVDPRMVFKAIGGMVATNLGDPKVFAVPALIMRESAQFPELAQMYRRDVIDKVLPVMRKLIAHQIELGRFRPVDPDLAIRSIVGPIIAHMAMAKVFGIVSEDGLNMDRMINQHIDILFNGLSAKPERKNG
ncbi:MAG: TetR/AcrR family transcriptional regulator [Alphaproteobacteria bacterium]|nr:TetR/AcrR family transcriptional regulator [Alphaproteobacteria bacterium]